MKTFSTSSTTSTSTKPSIENATNEMNPDLPSIDTELEKEYAQEVGDIHEKYELRKETKQFLTGKVVSDKAAKSIVVQIINQRYFPKYNRFVPTQRKVMAHDEEEVCNIGDYVRIIPCRPMSRKKRHKLFEVLKKANVF